MLWKGMSMGGRKLKRIVAAGHVCLDITPEFRNQPVEKMGDLMKPGSLVETGTADVHIGGSIANTGLGLKILGADVVLMGKIGKDSFGSHSQTTALFSFQSAPARYSTILESRCSHARTS